MPETPDIIVGKRSVWPFAVALVISLMPVVDLATGWPGIDGPKKWVLWALAPVMWVGTFMGFFTRIRVDAEGIEMRHPFFGVTRIAWSDVTGVYHHNLLSGTGTSVRGRDGQVISLSNMYANRAEIEAVVEERAGLRVP